MLSQQNKRFGIFGLAITGIEAYKFLTNQGLNVICYDDSKSTREHFSAMYNVNCLKNLSDSSWQNVDTIIVSPGIKPEHNIFKFATNYKINIISDIELFYEYNHKSCFIGVTGTNGKSTTTALINHILNIARAGDYSMGGNIGVPVLSLQAERVGYVLELSSFQLDLLQSVKLDMAVFLNVSPDHLDRYVTIENYINSKCKIFANMTKEDYVIINVDDRIIKDLVISQKIIGPTIVPFSLTTPQTGGVAIIGNKIYDNIFEPVITDLLDNQFLPGNHNKENIAASYAICRLLKIAVNDITAAISSFKGLSHRMQYLGNIGQVAFYNDSKATNIDSASKAISSLDNIYWLAGGIAKEPNLDRLEPYFHRIKKAYLYGRDKELFAASLKNKVSLEILDNLEEAFYRAYEDAVNDKSELRNILLAPAASSLDQFKSFEERGGRFIHLYNKLL